MIRGACTSIELAILGMDGAGFRLSNALIVNDDNNQ